MALSRTVTLLQLNDSHGYLEPHLETFSSATGAVYRTCGGYARIATVFKCIRAERAGAVIALDNGDTFHGTYHAVTSRGGAFVRPLNLLGFDGWTVHWDCGYGVDRLRELAGQLGYPLLACNCYHQEDGRLAAAPFTVIERTGIRVGVIGIAATILDKTMPAHFSAGLRLTLGNKEVAQHVRTLRAENRVDLVVVLSHLGFPQDLQLARDVTGIDVILSGHTHNRLVAPVTVNGTTLIQSGCHGSFVGRLDIELTATGPRVVKHELITVTSTIPEDPEMASVVAEITAPERGRLAQVVGQTATDLNRATFFESTMDNLLLQAVTAAGGTEIGFSNGWRYGAPVQAGPVTLNDLWNIIPTNPPISIIELTGAEIRAMLEESLEHSLSRDPYGQMGGYVKRCRGIRAHIKIENPSGTRIHELFAEGAELDVERVYRASFVTAQGVPLKYGRNRKDLSIRAIEALGIYLAENSPVHAPLLGTFTPV